MLEENLKDVSEAMYNLLTEPLTIEGTDREVTLLSAAKDFDPTHAEDSDLAKIMLNFLDYPERTQALLIELRLLSAELEI